MPDTARPLTPADLASFTGSDLRIFRRKRERDRFVSQLQRNGYEERS